MTVKNSLRLDVHAAIVTYCIFPTSLSVTNAYDAPHEGDGTNSDSKGSLEIGTHGSTFMARMVKHQG